MMPDSMNPDKQAEEFEKRYKAQQQQLTKGNKRASAPRS